MDACWKGGVTVGGRYGGVGPSDFFRVFSVVM